MIDLVLEAKKCGGTSVSDEPSRIVTLGMSIAGKEWRIDAVVLNLATSLDTPSFVSIVRLAREKSGMIKQLRASLDVLQADWG
jgi:hypothetical protein